MTVYFLLLFIALISMVRGIPDFIQRIPNGDNVPNPCSPGSIWRGVGHENPEGGGPLNPFGKDFRDNGKKWGEKLCKKDSDGDGKTNGEELCDPDCKFVSGESEASASQTCTLSNPGLCEPINSERCQGKNSFLPPDCRK